jgi:hypothetical protein
MRECCRTSGNAAPACGNAPDLVPEPIPALRNAADSGEKVIPARGNAAGNVPRASPGGGTRFPRSPAPFPRTGIPSDAFPSPFPHAGEPFPPSPAAFPHSGCHSGHRHERLRKESADCADFLAPKLRLGYGAGARRVQGPRNARDCPNDFPKGFRPTFKP